MLDYDAVVGDGGEGYVFVDYALGGLLVFMREEREEKRHTETDPVAS